MSADKHAPVPEQTTGEGRAAWLQRILDAVPAMVAYVGPDHRFQFVNRAYHTAYGGSARVEFIGALLEDVLGPALCARVSPYVDRALAGEDLEYTGDKVEPDGTRRTFRAHYVPDRAPDGVVLGFFALIFDTTAETRTQEDLRRSKESYRALVARSPQPMVVTVAGSIRFLNAAALRLVGEKRIDDMIGRSILDFVAEESLEEARTFKEAAKKTPDGIARAEVALRTRDERPRRVDISGLAFELEGEPAIQILLRDVTHQRRMEQDLIRTAKLESLGVLAGGIAHDFNNLLTGILGSIELMGQGEVDARTAGLIERARNNSERARELAGQLLTFSKGGEPITQVVASTPLVREAAEMVARCASVHLVQDLPEELWPVQVDAAQVHQVFNNITLNATQALSPGGTIRIIGRNRRITDPTVPGHPAGTWVVFTVEDDGAGISKEALGRIFDPYFSTRPGATGLGLSAAFSIVNHHGGWIDVRSTVGLGTSVEVGLPALPGAQLPIEDAVAEVVYGRGRVLVMDDETAVREVAREMLEALGYCPSLVPDGAAALTSWEAARAAGNPYDAVIMDLSIPGGMGGQEAIRHLLDADPDAVAIVSSGYSNNPVMANHRDHGFRGVIRKPYFLSELGRTLAEALGRRD